jgi:hypothetical protein
MTSLPRPFRAVRADRTFLLAVLAGAVCALGCGAPADAARNPHAGVGIGAVENNPIRARNDFLAERIVLDQDTRMRWFITGFNLEGVHFTVRNGLAPREIRSSRLRKPRIPTPPRQRRWVAGDGRIGYANGNGGTIWFRLVRARSDGRPDLTNVIASERINAITAYQRTKQEFGTGLTQLIGFRVNRTVPAGEYVVVIGNASRRPGVHYFSTNLPTHTGSAPNTRNERDPDAPGALGGLDPRETVMWSTSGGRSWVFGSQVGRGALFGYYNAGDNRRIPWYGWQVKKGERAIPQQPFNGYGSLEKSPRLRVKASAATTLTRAGGFTRSPGRVGTITVRTDAGSATTTRSLGRGLGSAPLDRPLPVAAGETYTITTTGSVPLARADRYVRRTFGTLPWTTVGDDGDRAELFAE